MGNFSDAQYPAPKNYGNFDTESFDSYYSRWPSGLSTIPREVVEDWIYRHWYCFRDDWMKLHPHNWSYRLVDFSNEQILAIDHVGEWIQELDAEGVEYVGGFPRSETRLARYMLEFGTFPVPIIVAENAGHVIHPRSNHERMKVPFQLIEGHCRLACVRGMITHKHPSTLSRHKVWLVKLP